MCCNADVNAQGGTAYTNAGQVAENEATFPDRTVAAVANSPQVVIVQGSTNDASADEDDLRRAALRTYNEVRTSAPSARLVVVGVTAAPAIDVRALQRVNETLSAAVAAVGTDSIDPIAENWLGNADHYNGDRIHPSETAALIYSFSSRPHEARREFAALLHSPANRVPSSGVGIASSRSGIGHGN